MLPLKKCCHHHWSTCMPLPMTCHGLKSGIPPWTTEWKEQRLSYASSCNTLRRPLFGERICPCCNQSVGKTQIYIEHLTTAHDKLKLSSVEEVLKSIVACNSTTFDIGRYLVRTVWTSWLPSFCLVVIVCGVRVCQSYLLYILGVNILILLEYGYVTWSYFSAQLFEGISHFSSLLRSLLNCLELINKQHE